MISNEVLDDLINNAAAIGEELSDLHSALVELRYRRQKMPKLEKATRRAKAQRDQVRLAVRSNPKSSGIRARMARLKFW